MNTKKQTSKPKNAPQEETGGDCPSAPCSPSSTPETDAILGGANDWNAFEEDIIAFSRKLERERNAMREWIMQAAPMLSVASCIVIDDAVERLGEIAGCRAVLELCPVDFIHPDNDLAHPRGY